MSTGWLLAACTEAKGKQDLWLRQKPQALELLREQALIQSVESSNRIEGVTVDKNRLQPLVLGRAKPRDRSEEEVVGYSKAIEWISSRTHRVAIEPRDIQHLHSLAQGGMSGDAGEWKRRNNEIIEILPSGERRVRFMPTSAKETPRAVDQLCERYQNAREEDQIHALILVATFVFDLLCIHPFRDGNGRVSRLVTTLLLLEHGYEVVRYISLERLVEENKDDYYEVLRRCSDGWHAGKNEIVPWWNYFLGIVHQAYRSLAEQAEASHSEGVKGDAVRKAILQQVGPFSLSDLRGQLPAVSVQLIKKVLAELKRAGQVRLTGRGRGAYWERVNK